MMFMKLNEKTKQPPKHGKKYFESKIPHDN